MSISSLFSSSSLLSRLSVKGTAATGSPAPAAKTEGKPVDPAMQEKDAMNAAKKEREIYDAQRHAEIDRRRDDFRKTYGRDHGANDPPLGFQMALPVNERGYMPFVSADQQKMIDSITDRYLNREDITPMWEELSALGLNPQQLAKSAKYFTSLDGRIATREEATKGVNIMV